MIIGVNCSDTRKPCFHALESKEFQADTAACSRGIISSIKSGLIGGVGVFAATDLCSKLIQYEKDSGSIKRGDLLEQIAAPYKNGLREFENFLTGLFKGTNGEKATFGKGFVKILKAPFVSAGKFIKNLFSNECASRGPKILASIAFTAVFIHDIVTRANHCNGIAHNTTILENRYK